MDDPHDDTDVPSGTTDGAQMERTLPGPDELMALRNEQTEVFQLLSCFTASAAGQRASVQLRELL